MLGLALVFGAAVSATAQPAGHWPDGHQAAIALTYDDAAPSQLDFAVPQLDAAGLKGTFFLTGNRMTANVERWRAVGAEGHELANHAINHPCARGTYDMPAPYTSENYTVETMLTEIGTMNGYLEALDHKMTHAYGTPCEQNLMGGQDYIGPLVQGHLASFIRDHRTMPALVMYTGFVGKSGADMIAWVESVRRAHAAGVIVFHGVGGDYLTTSAEAHQQLVDYLKAHEREIWTTTFSALMTAAVAQANPADGTTAQPPQ